MIVLHWQCKNYKENLLRMKRLQGESDHRLEGEILKTLKCNGLWRNIKELRGAIWPNWHVDCIRRKVVSIPVLPLFWNSEIPDFPKPTWPVAGWPSSPGRSAIFLFIPYFPSQIDVSDNYGRYFLKLASHHWGNVMARPPTSGPKRKSSNGSTFLSHHCWSVPRRSSAL